MDKQCAECPIGRHPDAPCPVLLQSIHMNYDQCDNPKLREALNITVDENGICQMKKVMTDYPNSIGVRKDIKEYRKTCEKTYGDAPTDYQRGVLQGLDCAEALA